MLIFALTVVAMIDSIVAAQKGAMICGIPAWLLAMRTVQECAAGMAAVKAALKTQEQQDQAAAKLTREALASMGVPEDEERAASALARAVPARPSASPVQPSLVTGK
jgi:hypothetical protein